jgi:hypothetical protein
VAVVEGDALAFKAHVLALKYAQQHYGLDMAVADSLRDRYSNLGDLLPKINGFRFLQSGGSIRATAVLFVGVKDLDRRELPPHEPANLAGSPVLDTDESQGRVAVFMIPVRQWSDGTDDSEHAH